MAKLRKFDLFHHLREEGSDRDDKRLIIYPVAYFKKEGLSLQRVYEMSNSVSQAWISAAMWDAGGIMVAVRSTSVGDIIVDRDTGDWWRVVSFGFKRLTDHEKAQYTVMRPGLERYPPQPVGELVEVGEDGRFSS